MRAGSEGRIGRLALAILLLGASPLPAQREDRAPEVSHAVRELIRGRLERPAVPDVDVRGPVPAPLPAPAAAAEELRLPGPLLSFYEGRGFEPAWSRSGTVGGWADQLLGTLRQAHQDGLRGADYHLAAAERLLAEVRHEAGEDRVDPRELADLDLLLTDGFLTYGGHLLVGRLEPASLEPRWAAETEDVDLPRRLEDALERDAVGRSLRELIQGSDPGYSRLRSALAQYRSIAARGGWPTLPDTVTLRRGDVGPAVEALRRRLVISRDYGTSADADATLNGAAGRDWSFDAELEEAVRRFQRRHGLSDDGAVGARTRSALDVPAHARARQIELNLERWRWLPRDLGRRYVLVNSAGFLVDVVDAGRRSFHARAIVGSEYTQTPVFSDTISYLVFNPTWSVPRNIAVREILPKAVADPDYLRREGFRIVAYDGREVDPATIAWPTLDPSRFPHRIQQDPGPRNALGRVKFMFPNPYSVYLHDTPERALFDRPARGFSHGCIRVEAAMELARRLLDSADGWTPERIDEISASGRETTVAIRDPMPIHVGYWTAWADPDGTVHFRDDVYERDRALDAALPSVEPRRP